MDDETLNKPISKKETKIVEALTIEEQKKLENVLDHIKRNHKYRNIAKIQLETGARIGEVLARSISNVDLENNSILIDNTLTKDKNEKTILGKHTKTFNKVTNIDSGKRIFPLNDTLKEIFTEELSKKLTNIHQLIFWDYNKNTFISYNSINSWLERLNKKYKISSKELSTHVLRHTRITRMREAGMDMKVIQYLVGHIEGSKITDDIYTSVSSTFVKQELEKLA